MILFVNAYEAMLLTYNEGQYAFDRLNTVLGIDLPISEYLQINRMHKSNISYGVQAQVRFNCPKCTWMAVWMLER